MVGKELPVTKGDVSMYNVVTLGIGMSLVLAGIKVGSNFIVPIFGNSGAMCLACLYFASAFASFVAPPIMNLFSSEKSALAILAFEYVIYVCVFIYYIPVVGYVWSLVHGILSCTFWIEEGRYLSANMTDRDKGKKSGIFWSLYMIGTVFGNFGGYIIMKTQKFEGGNAIGWTGAGSIMFIVLALASLFGCIPMFFLKDAPKSVKKVAGTKTPTMQLIKRLLKLCVSKDMIWLIMSISYLGYQFVFVGGMVTRQCHNMSDVGLMTAVYALVETIVSMFLGQMMDRFGMMSLMTMGTVTQILGTLFAWYGNIYQNWTFYICFICLALSDSAYQTLIPAVIGGFEDQESANGIFRLFQNLGGFVCYILCPLFVATGANLATNSKFLMELWINVILAIITAITYYVFERKVKEIADGKKPVVVEKVDKVSIHISNEELEAVNRGEILADDATSFKKSDIEMKEDFKSNAKSNEDFVQ